MNKRNYTEDLLKIVDCLLNKEIEESDIIQAETSLLDYLAVTIYGANEKKNFANDFLGGFNSDKGEICQAIFWERDKKKNGNVRCCR